VNLASTSFILGYHGCDIKLAERVLTGRSPLKSSHNDYDWLGDGIYFWEHNAQRAFDFAREVAEQPHPSGQKIKTPSVIGAIIDFGNCLNLLDSRSFEAVRLAHLQLEESSKMGEVPLPRNTGGSDLRSRNLDCAVLRTLHKMRSDAGSTPFDTVRAVFIEGGPLYDTAGFRDKNHIQVCVRNPRCIKGYFRPFNDEGTPMSFA